MRVVPKTENFQLIIPSQTRYLNLVTSLTKRSALIAGFDDTRASKVSIAVDEAVTHIILHAYQQDPNQSLELVFTFTPKLFEITIFHSGSPLTGDRTYLPDAKDYNKDPHKNDLGLLLMTRFMDEVRFAQGGAQDPRHTCRMIKAL